MSQYSRLWLIVTKNPTKSNTTVTSFNNKNKRAVKNNKKAKHPRVQKIQGQVKPIVINNHNINTQIVFELDPSAR